MGGVADAGDDLHGSPPEGRDRELVEVGAVRDAVVLAVEHRERPRESRDGAMLAASALRARWSVRRKSSRNVSGISGMRGPNSDRWYSRISTGVESSRNATAREGRWTNASPIAGGNPRGGAPKIAKPAASRSARVASSTT